MLFVIVVSLTTKPIKVSLQIFDLSNRYQPIQGPFSSQEHLFYDVVFASQRCLDDHDDDDDASAATGL